MLTLFTNMAELEMVKDSLADDFLPELIAIIRENTKDKTIVRNGMVL